MVTLATAHRGNLVEGPERLKLRAAILLALARRLARSLQMDPNILDSFALAELAGEALVSRPVELALDEFGSALVGETPEARHLEAAHRIGEALDILLASERDAERKKSGSYFTPTQVARSLITRSLLEATLRNKVKASVRICDPACGGGAFLLEAAVQVCGLQKRRGEDFRERRKLVANELFGVDLSPLAISVTAVALWLFVGLDAPLLSNGPRWVVGDALFGAVVSDEDMNTRPLEDEGIERFDFFRAFPEVFGRGASEEGFLGFDWIVGNPPWVAFQGRATQVISPARRTFYRQHYRAYAGYPTLHGLFVERSASLAPFGHVSLLLPSSVSDLDGYAKTRATLCQRHKPILPLLEFGHDAFEGVVQPCFGLVALPRRDGRKEENRSEEWPLEERTRAGAPVARVESPAILRTLEKLPSLVPDTFREMGFQSNRSVASALFLRAQGPEGDFSVPLLEGRNVGEFSERKPRLFLKPDIELLRATKCRLKTLEVYAAVDLVVRQTASFTIAAKHGDTRFRNSLIGAFATSAVDTNLLLALMNSALYRALHISRQRDARQAVFPQVKISHLRRLPAPPSGEELRERLRRVAAEATAQGGLSQDARIALDNGVFALFGLSREEGEEVRSLLVERAPTALRPSLS